MRKLQVIAFLAALSASACERDPRDINVHTRLSREAFVAVMTDLGQSQPHQRATILKKHHTNDAEIREFVEKYSAYPNALSSTFDSIQAHLRGPGNRPEPR